MCRIELKQQVRPHKITSFVQVNDNLIYYLVEAMDLVNNQVCSFFCVDTGEKTSALTSTIQI